MAKTILGTMHRATAPKRKDPLYNTGKVIIGAAYAAPAPLPDADDERVQRALLGKPEPRSLWVDAFAGACVFLSVIALLHFDKWTR